MRRLFGTDGVRGVVGDDLTADLVERLGRAFALWSGGDDVLVGRDTRASGPELEAALARGLASGGSAVTLAGILPTPAVALLARRAGAVISASHNPAAYNGVKFFAPEGRKLLDSEEEAIEGLLQASSSDGGTVRRDESRLQAYVDVICDRFGTALDGLRIAVDCANGALSDVAPPVLDRLGAHVTPLANEPDGENINDGCGATDLSLVTRAVRRDDFDLGVAFDGDGDRMLAVEATGQVIDGDQILAVLALHLGVDVVVVTAMSNLGFHKLMAERGIRTVTTNVGDRYVLEALRAEGAVLGGEQAGHIVYLEGHTTGDGLVAALLLARALVESGRTLSELAQVMPVFPQVQESVQVRIKEISPRLREEIDRLSAQLAGRGRILVRPSGTEPVMRILAEAEDSEDAETLCAKLAHLVREELG